MTRFCHEAVVFGSAFSDTRFGAKRTMGDNVAGDDEEHLVDESGNRARFVVGPACRIRKMAQGIQAAFEGKANDVGIVCERGFLHDAADEVVSNEMHSQFAFDHMGRKTAEDIHFEMDLNFFEVKFDSPAAKVEIGEVSGGNIGIEQGGDDCHDLSAKTVVSDGVADHANGKAFGETGKLFWRHSSWALGRTFPCDPDIKIGRFGELGGDGFADLLFR